MPRSRVLVVEDDDRSCEYYMGFFNEKHRDEFRWALVRTGQKALEALTLDGLPVDIILLDWSLPGMSGLEVLRRIRRHKALRSTLVFMVTAYAGLADRVKALETGADDILAKPFAEEELLARLRSLLRRQASPYCAGRVFELDGVKLDADARRLRVHGREVELQAKQAELLAVFLRHPGIIHRAYSLWSQVWRYESPSWRDTLNTQISLCRRKLGPEWGPRLECVRDEGYRLATIECLR